MTNTTKKEDQLTQAEISALTSGLWDCPTLPSGKQIVNEIHCPGSKSYSNRYLLLQYLTEFSGGNQSVELVNLLASRDSELMSFALSQFKSAGLDEEITVNCGLAGTVMRFLPPVAALRSGRTIFTGDPQALKRPMGPVLDGLEQIGVRIERMNGDFMPFAVVGTGWVKGGRAVIDASASSQFVSGLLLSGALFEEGLEIVHTGDRLPSVPHIDMTVKCLHDAGVKVSEEEPGVWQVSPGPINLPSPTFVEADLSNMMVFGAAILANPAGGVGTIHNWPSDSIQPGRYFLDVLERMGASIEHRLGNGGLEDVTITSDGTIQGVFVDLSKAGEIAPTVAALCAIADSPSSITGIGNLRGHETDRLEAIVTEVGKLGRVAGFTPDDEGIWIGTSPDAGERVYDVVFESYNDHRMATFAAIVGLRVPGCKVNNIGTTSKTMPGFEIDWTKFINGEQYGSQEKETD
jgi:3-phosphoshikimate 1-carboxyvinyltransferase